MKRADKDLAFLLQYDEERYEHYVLEAMGVRTAMEGVNGYYPAFDITPPHLVSGVVTDKGIFSPYDLNRYY